MEGKNLRSTKHEARTTKVICKSMVMAAAADAAWFQTFPAFGKYSVGGVIKGAKPDAVFVFDEDVAQQIVADFKQQREAHPDWPGILVDREHFSCYPEKPSDAMAWAVDIRINDDGSIWTKWEFTPKGKELWDSKTLVNRSPCFDCEADNDDIKKAHEFRAVRLVSIGMTNTPHFDALSSLAAAKSAAEVNKNKGEIHMEKILAALGLAPEATEDEAVAAIQALNDKASAAETKATEAEEEKDKAVAECRELKADAFLKAHESQIADVAKCRAAFIKDPELAETMLAACKNGTGAVAGAPQQVLAAAKKDVPKGDVYTQLAACKTPEERIAFVTAHAKEFA